MRSRSRSRPRIFNGRTRSKSAGKPRKGASVESIGSVLSEQDQFDILVFKSANKGGSDDRRSRSIFSYFTSDMEASTVSSLTTDEYHHSYGNSAFPAAAATAATTSASATSWCCCSDTTQPTTSATHADYNTLVYRDGDDMDGLHDNMAGDTVAPPRRPRIKFGSYWRRKKSEMSPSLFDALQEEDPYNKNDAEPAVVRQQQSRRRSRSMSFFSKRGSSALKQ